MVKFKFAKEPLNKSSPRNEAPRGIAKTDIGCYKICEKFWTVPSYRGRSMRNQKEKIRQNYATRRESLRYYKIIRSILTCITKNCESIIDVGANITDMLSHLRVPHKVALDLRNPLEREGIISVKANWLDFPIEKPYDIVCCFQVLEHIPEDLVTLFAQKLFDSGKTVVISIPYKWEKGRVKTHIHDPVDEGKLFSWTGREPAWSIIVTEAGKSKSRQRLIAVYPEDTGSFSTFTAALLENAVAKEIAYFFPNRIQAFFISPYAHMVKLFAHKKWHKKLLKILQIFLLRQKIPLLYILKISS